MKKLTDKEISAKVEKIVEDTEAEVLVLLACYVINALIDKATEPLKGAKYGDKKKVRKSKKR